MSIARQWITIVLMLLLIIPTSYILSTQVNSGIDRRSFQSDVITRLDRIEKALPT